MFGKKKDQYIKLDEKDLQCLVRGGVLHCGDIHIILSDIGFDQMTKAIDLAMDGIHIHKDHIKQQ